MQENNKRTSDKKWERILGLVALVLVAAAWFVGTFKGEMDIAPKLHEAIPGSSRIEPVGDGVYKVFTEKDREMLAGFIAVASGHGFGGRMTVAVASGLAGNINNLVVVNHRETAPFMRRVLAKDYLESLQGKNHIECFTIGEDVDGVAGATYTSRALADAARRGVRKIASQILNYKVLEEEPPAIVFGKEEIVLIALFLFAFLGTRKWFKYKKTARWSSLLLSLALLGFMFNKPLTLIYINKMLLGFWPAWQTHLYWYMMLAFVLLFIIVEGKNLYCDRVCPFGAAQETIGAIGGAKFKLPPAVHRILRWLQKILALLLVLSAMVTTNPATFNYEVFGALFHLVGSNFLFILLGLVLVSSLLIKRPWCHYLCPIRPVTDLVLTFRNWIKRK
jgi:uncharacterized protein with FMN-binding domain